MSLRALPQLALPLLVGGPALAEEWTCTLFDACYTDTPCETREDTLFATIEVDDEESQGRFVLSKGKPNETWMPLRLIAESGKARSFYVNIDNGEAAFVSIFVDGSAALSAHGREDGDIWVSAKEGICKGAEH